MAHKCDGCQHKGEHREMMFRPMGVCNRGANLLEAVKNYEAEKCPYKKTNADRIRAMSDEELAWLLMEFRFDAFGKATGNETALPDSQRKICEWLQQPAEGVS